MIDRQTFQQHIDELIEESYLLTLTGQELRMYLRIFLDSCDLLLRERLSMHSDVRVIGLKITILRARLLLDEKVALAARLESRGVENKTTVEFLAEQILSTKRIVFTILNEINPKLSGAVLDESRKRRNSLKQQSVMHSTVVNGIIGTGFYLLLVVTVVLLILFLFR